MDTRVVLITGALTGIGRAAALAFAREGARVVVSGRREDAGQALAHELRALGAEAEFIQADVRKDEQVRALVDRAVARFGRLDAAVNNAGTEGTPGPVTEQTAETYATAFDTNVLGTLFSMKHELRVMQAQRFGSIVNISSAFGHEGAPGAIETAMLNRFTGTSENKAALALQAPLARLGEPHEIAQAIVFAASGKSSFMTGHILAIDGGRAAT